MQIPQQGPVGLVTIGDTEYQIHAISAMKQFHIARRLAPVIARLFPLLNISGALGAMFEDGEEGLPALTTERRQEIFRDIIAGLPDLAESFAHLSDEDSEYIINACLDACWRKQDTGWARVRSQGVMMFNDIKLPAMMKLAFEAIRKNMGGFFEQDQLTASATGPKSS
jgi:hypothetical protein